MKPAQRLSGHPVAAVASEVRDAASAVIREQLADRRARSNLEEEQRSLKIFLVNPSDKSFGTAVITPRWMYVLAGATPADFGDPVLADETLDPLDLDRIRTGDVVGISVHTANALRGYEIGKRARERGAWVVF